MTLLLRVAREIDGCRLLLDDADTARRYVDAPPTAGHPGWIRFAADTDRLAGLTAKLADGSRLLPVPWQPAPALALGRDRPGEVQARGRCTETACIARFTEATFTPRSDSVVTAHLQATARLAEAHVTADLPAEALRQALGRARLGVRAAPGVPLGEVLEALVGDLVATDTGRLTAGGSRLTLPDLTLLRAAGTAALAQAIAASACGGADLHEPAARVAVDPGRVDPIGLEWRDGDLVTLHALRRWPAAAGAAAGCSADTGAAGDGSAECRTLTVHGAWEAYHFVEVGDGAAMITLTPEAPCASVPGGTAATDTPPVVAAAARIDARMPVRIAEGPTGALTAELPDPLERQLVLHPDAEVLAAAGPLRLDVDHPGLLCALTPAADLRLDHERIRPVIYRALVAAETADAAFAITLTPAFGAPVRILAAAGEVQPDLGPAVLRLARLAAAVPDGAEVLVAVRQETPSGPIALGTRTLAAGDLGGWLVDPAAGTLAARTEADGHATAWHCIEPGTCAVAPRITTKPLVLGTCRPGTLEVEVRARAGTGQHVSVNLSPERPRAVRLPQDAADPGLEIRVRPADAAEWSAWSRVDGSSFDPAEMLAPDAFATTLAQGSSGPC